MAYAGRTGRNSTLGSALGIVLLAVLVVAIAVFLALNPKIVENILYVAIIILVVIVVVAVIIFLAAAILALPYYAVKGEEYQMDATYDLDDVKPVKEKDSRDKDE